MKKTLLALTLAAVLIFPLGIVALASHEQASVPDGDTGISGSTPAETWAAESMAPALHGAVLAMISQDRDRFDSGDSALAWECLYNMLSLYGQLDSRAEAEDGILSFPAETVWDYAAALGLDLQALPALPRQLAGRLAYDARQDCYQAVCGNDDLAQLQVREARAGRGQVTLEGALTYLVDGTDLVHFQAVLDTQDTMFGYVLTSLELTAQ